MISSFLGQKCIIRELRGVLRKADVESYHPHPSVNFWPGSCVVSLDVVLEDLILLLQAQTIIRGFSPLVTCWQCPGNVLCWILVLLNLVTVVKVKGS